VEMVIALQAAGRLLVVRDREVAVQVEAEVVREQRDQQGCRGFRLVVLVEQPVQQVLLVEQALRVLLVEQALLVRQALQDQQGLLGRIYRVTLMLRG
jgi:hypothetical protein